MQNNFTQESPRQQTVFTNNSLNKYNPTFSNNIQNPNSNNNNILIQDEYQNSKNIQEKSLYDWFHDKEYDKYRQYDRFEKCRKCELLRFCRGCPAVTYGYSHNMYGRDPQCWKEVN